MPAVTTITNKQKIPFTLSPTTESGEVAAVDGKPTYERISGDAELVLNEDALSGKVVSGNLGDTIFIVRADADLGEGVVEISDTMKISVIGEQAKNLGLGFGVPEPK